MQRFRISQNKMVHAGGHDFVYLVEESAIYEIDRPIRETLDRLARRQAWTEGEVLEQLEGATAERRDLFAGLLKRRLIAAVNGESLPERRVETARVSVPLQTLILQVTESCNLGCAYCYHAQKGREAGEARTRMSPEVAKKAVDFLLEKSGGLEELVLVFFGGEPLLQFGLIASAAEYARREAARRGKKIDFALTTNGTLLSPDVVRFLHENRIGVTVSIDGFEEVHDRYRRFADGRPSYGAMLEGVRELLKGAGERPVVARVTVAKNTLRVPEILHHLLGLGFAEAGFSPVTTADASYQLDEDGMELLLDQFRVLADEFVQAAEKDEFLGFSNLIDLLVVLHQGEVKNYPCGAGLGLFSVDPGGNLYLCQRLTGEEPFCMGNIFEGLDAARLEKFRMAAEIGNKRECRHCWVRSSCAGGCYHEAWVREGDAFKPNSHYCRWIRNWVETGLEVYGRIYSSNPDYLDKLSMLRGHASIFNEPYVNNRRSR